jgi:isocitrate dehydrogenase (NAD+)
MLCSPPMARVTMIRGDGIGPEIMDAAICVLEATGAKLEWEERYAGTMAIDKLGTPVPDETIQSIRANQLAFKGPLATPIGGGYRSVNVAFRQELDLYSNVRPAKSMAGVKTPFSNVDLVVIRENTQELYSGIEHYIDPKKDAAQAISFISKHACDRIVRFAFEYARANQRKKVTLVHKANILKLTTGLFLNVGKQIAALYPDIQFEDRIVDAMAMSLVMRPQQFEVIVTTNMFGDILSDLTAGLIGGLGLAPSGNYGEAATIFEAIHGTAPDIAGKGIANPTALILSGAMMLRHLGYAAEAGAVERTVRELIAEGKIVTPDLGGSASTIEFGRAVAALLS